MQVAASAVRRRIDNRVRTSGSADFRHLKTSLTLTLGEHSRGSANTPRRHIVACHLLIVPHLDQIGVRLGDRCQVISLGASTIRELRGRWIALEKQVGVAALALDSLLSRGGLRVAHQLVDGRCPLLLWILAQLARIAAALRRARQCCCRRRHLTRCGVDIELRLLWLFQSVSRRILLVSGDSPAVLIECLKLHRLLQESRLKHI